MKRLLLFYILVAAGVSVASVFLYWPPAPQIMLWFAGDDGKYPIAAVLGILFLIYVLPFTLIVFVVNQVRGLKKQTTPLLLDQAILEITRKRALFGAVYGMDIYLNGNKVGTVMNGRTVQFSMPFGTNEIQVQSQGKSTEKVIVETSEIGIAKLTVGFHLTGNTQELFLRKF